jgi:TatD DNase family protein
MGFYLGFNGIIFKLNLDEIIKKTPLAKILIETDCPYLTPPMAVVEKNEPLFVKYVAEKIAKIKNISDKEIADITTQNAKKLFKIRDFI